MRATEVTGLAAGHHYLGFFFDPVGTIYRLYQCFHESAPRPADDLGEEDRNYSISEVRGQIREMVDFSANGAG